MKRYLCIHAHFYQPPRENPWLETVELQDSAYPFHDWNERVTAECYAANASSRILDGEGRIEQIVNNYKSISFNFGPTLLSWLEGKEPEVYRAILTADRESRDRFSGHGSALAQGYNHPILPLTNQRDKHTQILWGIRDFERRFGRKPEGMWLPETAVDLECLQIMRKSGIRFTILAPQQASRVRKKDKDKGDWQDVSGGRIDPTIPYEARLPSGQKIALFFYDGPVSRAVAFEGLLESGERFAERLMGGFPATDSPAPRLVHIATDGETYGHHHRWGEMALSSALQHIDSHRLARITNYAEFLEIHPPTHEVEIFENSSWSCVHGIERWRSNCGCNSGRHPDWNQEWRAPLREALDGIRDDLAAGFEERSRRLLKHPWAARDDYIEVLLDRSRESISGFFGKHAKRTLSGEQETEALTLLEIQRHAMLMYTSCGWFFDEISGLETVQVLQYAGRALQLAGGLYDGGIEARFLKRLEACKSNLSDHRDGRSVYERFVRPAMLDLRKFGAHYAATSLFEPYEDRARLYCYDVEREDSRSLRTGEARLAMGKVKITSAITLEEGTYGFGVLHLGDHNVSGGIREYREEESYAALLKEIGEPFRRADLPETLRAVDRTFGAQTFSLKFLFRDHRRKILQALLQKSEGDAISAYRRVYDQNALLMRFLSDVGHPIPHPFLDAAELAIGTGLREAFGADAPDTERIEALLEEAAIFKIPLDEGGLAYTLAKNAERIVLQFCAAPSELVRLQSLEAFVRIGQLLPFQVHFWKTQNVFHEMLQAVYPGFLQRAAEGDENAESWVRRFTELGERLSFRMKRD